MMSTTRTPNARPSSCGSARRNRFNSSIVNALGDRSGTVRFLIRGPIFKNPEVLGSGLLPRSLSGLISQCIPANDSDIWLFIQQAGAVFGAGCRSCRPKQRDDWSVRHRAEGDQNIGGHNQQRIEPPQIHLASCSRLSIFDVVPFAMSPVRRANLDNGDFRFWF